ncbi:ATP-binding protein [Roseivirga sp. BDSF3-8]|uniref:ATP-binding protein n=1 Tax=Roseivirga sp. BDSF3-8 TaxID=3241598 RepID=UPI0035322A24
MLSGRDASDDKDEKRFAGKVSENLIKEVGELERLTEYLDLTFSRTDSVSFSTFAKDSPFPFVVFLEGRLLYWSDSEVVPVYREVKGNYSLRAVNLNKSWFIASRRNINRAGAQYEIISLLPLYRDYPLTNNYIKSSYNQDVFGEGGVLFSNEPEQGYYSINDEDGNYLISIQFLPGYHMLDQQLKGFLFLLFLMGVALYIWGLSGGVALLEQNVRYLTAWVFLTTAIVVLRVVMIVLELPFSVIGFEVFNSRYYASSFLNPSLGDLLLNSVALSIISLYLFYTLRRITAVRRALMSNPIRRFILSICFLLTSLSSLHLVFLLPRTIILHSQWSLDITESILFDSFRVVSILIFALLALTAFLIIHSCFSLSIRLLKQVPLRVIGALSLAILVFAILVSLNGDFPLETLGILTIYVAILFLFGLPRNLSTMRYPTFLYIFLGVMAMAFTGALSIYKYGRTSELRAMDRFGNELLIENDLFGEYLLDEATSNISSDAFIKNRLFSAFASKEIIEQKIRRVHLNNYFDKYDIQISLFNAAGEPMNNSPSNYRQLRETYAKERFETEYTGIYFVNDIQTDQPRRYLSFIDVSLYGSTVGHIVIDMRLKKFIPNSIYPELLVDNRFVQSGLGRDFSYAVYSEGELAYSYGNFNYQVDFPKELMEQTRLYDEGKVASGFLHHAVSDEDETDIIVSVPAHSNRILISNFSFLFLVGLFLLLLSLLALSIVLTFKKIQLNFAAKIQLYLNLAFFLPLLAISISTTILVSKSYRDNITRSYVDRTENLSRNLSGILSRYAGNRVDREELNNYLAQFAEFTESDLNLYNTQGRLIATSLPMVYDNGLVSRYINPQVLKQFRDDKFASQVMSESIGLLQYRSTYRKVLSAESGKALGILGIPFFESQAELDRQLTLILTQVINVFAFLFIILLFLSYFASRVLTFPLRLITQKIRRTSLTGQNEPLKWRAEDEIGLMVGEYNRMLKNLEESRKALARSEKESAWREMAKQVAHEIKNPLTPMKLTLQHMQRVVQSASPEVADKTRKQIHSLLEQVETLSNIATTFSSFAKMPVPESELFDVSEALARAVRLFQNHEAEIVADIEEGTHMVLGDEQLTGRIFNNLIINGIQSVPKERSARVSVKLFTTHNHKVRVEVSDNGSGIPDHISKKVFLPNFTTKAEGSGIGLAIARRGVEHAGGSIWFETTEGEGTTFFIEWLKVE